MRTDGFVVDALLEQGLSDQEIVAELYGRAFAREPDEDECRTLEGYLAAESEAGRSRRQSLSNVLWAILNSKEFQMNL